MRWTHGLRARLRLLFRGAAEARMEEELAFHLEMETEKNLREGMSPAEARRRARLAFGGVEGHKEAMRDGRTFAWAGGLSLDFRLGFRMLRRYPGLTLVGGLAMAFAIGVGASVFEFLGQVARPTLPLPGGGRIVGIRQWDAAAGRGGGARERAGAPRLRGLARGAHVRGRPGRLPDHPAQPGGARRPGRARGRGGDERLGGPRGARPPAPGPHPGGGRRAAGGSPAVVIGHDVWRARFGGDAGVVGRTVRLGSGEATVVGVMPEGFAFPVAHGMWVPLRLDALDYEHGQGPSLEVFGRLAPGATLREAQAELATLGRRAAADHPRTHAHLRPRVMPYAASITGLSGVQSLGVMSLNLFLVMLLVLVCGNVALLLFAWAATRESEIVVRNALGASRGRIIMQLFTEALVLAGVAAVVGLAAARSGLGLVHGLVEHAVLEGERLPFWFDGGLSPRTVLYALVLTAFGAVIAGVVPALKVTRGLGTRLRRATAGGGGFRFGGVWTAVIVTQVAVTVLFPVMALATQRDAAKLRAVEVGFAEEEYLSARLEIDREPPPGAAADTSRAALLARYATLYRELERRLQADPGVLGVTFADRLPRMYHDPRLVEVDEGGQAAPDPRWPGHRVSTASVGTDYFEVLGAPVLAGRGFQPGDAGADARVVVVNQSFVDRVLGGRNPVGRRLRLAAGGERGPRRRSRGTRSWAWWGTWGWTSARSPRWPASTAPWFPAARILPTWPSA